MATISNAYIQTFESNVRHLAQQSVVRLRPYVQERGVESQNHNWDRLAATNASLKTTRLQPTPVANAAWSRRVSPSNTRDNGESVENEDVVQMLIEPKSALTTNMALSMRRAWDDEIIVAATGDATTEGGGTATFPAGQKITDAAAPINFDHITEVQQKFLANDIEADVPKVAVVGPIQVRKLMQLTEQTSSDYVRQKLDQLSSTGICIGWMGFTWIMSTRLTDGGSAGQKACLFFTNSAIGVKVSQDISVLVGRDPSVSFAWRVYTWMNLGAVRVEDEHIVWLQIKDDIT